MINPTEYIKQKYTTADGNPRVLKGITRQELYKLFAQLGYTKGCEVGVEKGKNAQNMFECIPNLQLYAVDPYKQHPQCSYEATAYLRRWDDRYLRAVKRQAQKRLQDKNAVIIEKFSEDGVKDIPDNSLDFVYIDGDHSYDAVMQDIILWGRKVRKGGIISGHDYFYDNNKEGRKAKVTQAVNDYTRVHGIEFYITGEDKYVKKGDISPSWFWVKMEDIYPNVVGA
ncbi:hypothetical protein A2858_00010 [Candidatus Daviesbacteria bacterium RIFCSPHIGHO2_01_FULL_36_37]|uniref:Class I SAM-dependent methyltransferase n=3 Tax=Candidatus Daviesiibacteriota TaxID=1752718 RepID=A0A0G0EP54_9BACT|nr:MAG: hypothetical protein US19_C0051G0014 [Candidatus Daviesbacteria bacterium GW2011_GWB1_36_5]OGE17002.1 MAG: hypothetical protein A2858_00010 [Candidatus Daviesbacteria bacterium RIFCSPHIGHO2_01_FULL_36_37]OGE32552.1 MAG: hypothetical protein A3C99_00215 [Candidatus Daviesbacteria bacterium RIFCSPHIGHO2_02_FULL_37_9]OGE35671.1 MAG: hypothetical protein A3E66_04375 [Candidatus Daviesbacteria bacterium RIFCSPHIGHO2_12_FULL_37_16]